MLRFMTPATYRQIKRAVEDSSRRRAAALRELLSRVDVTDEDIGAFGLGDPIICEHSPAVATWCRENGVTLTGSGAIEALNCSAMAHDWVINGLAGIVDRPPLDVLAEIARLHS